MPEADAPLAGGRAKIRSSNSAMLRRSIAWSAVATVVIAVAGSVIGFLVAEMPGVYSALVGAVLAALFLGLTAVIMLVAAHYQPAGNITVYFGIVIGGWAIKLVLFLVVLIMLRGQSWIHGYVFFFCVLASVIASLVIDLVVMAKTPVTYASHVGPRPAVAAAPEASDAGVDRPAGQPEAP